MRHALLDRWIYDLRIQDAYVGLDPMMHVRKQA